MPTRSQVCSKSRTEGSVLDHPTSPPFVVPAISPILCSPRLQLSYVSPRRSIKTRQPSLTLLPWGWIHSAVISLRPLAGCRPRASQKGRIVDRAVRGFPSLKTLMCVSASLEIRSVSSSSAHEVRTSWRRLTCSAVPHTSPSALAMS